MSHFLSYNGTYFVLPFEYRDFQLNTSIGTFQRYDSIAAHHFHGKDKKNNQYLKHSSPIRRSPFNFKRLSRLHGTFSKRARAITGGRKRPKKLKTSVIFHSSNSHQFRHEIIKYFRKLSWQRYRVIIQREKFGER